MTTKIENGFYAKEAAKEKMTDVAEGEPSHSVLNKPTPHPHGKTVGVVSSESAPACDVWIQTEFPVVLYCVHAHLARDCPVTTSRAFVLIGKPRTKALGRNE